MDPCLELDRSLIQSRPQMLSLEKLSPRSRKGLIDGQLAESSQSVIAFILRHVRYVIISQNKQAVICPAASESKSEHRSITVLLTQALASPTTPFLHCGFSGVRKSKAHKAPNLFCAFWNSLAQRSSALNIFSNAHPFIGSYQSLNPAQRTFLPSSPSPIPSRLNIYISCGYTVVSACQTYPC